MAVSYLGVNIEVERSFSFLLFYLLWIRLEFDIWRDCFAEAILESNVFLAVEDYLYFYFRTLRIHIYLYQTAWNYALIYEGESLHA